MTANANTYLPGVIQIPSSLLIASITQSYPMIVTIEVNPDTASNTYQAHQLVKFFIPREYGMWQLNGLQGEIIQVLDDEFLISIDSTNFDPFSIPSGNVTKPASLAPSGSRNLELGNTTNQVPFQSLNNRGN